MLEIRHLKTLIALRETGSLVEAAERVFLTQSALSHQLKELESKLECELFIRKSRPLRFSEAGKRLLLLADDVLASGANLSAMMLSAGRCMHTPFASAFFISSSAVSSLSSSQRELPIWQPCAL